MNSDAQKRIFRSMVIVVAASLLVAGAVFAFNFPGLGKGESIKGVNGVVSIPVAKVDDGKAHFYRISDGDKVISFFVVKAPDGTIKTAFDACDVCYREKKGYEQQKEVMICKQCNKKFPIDRIGPHAVGGCNPSYLPSTLAGGNVQISVDELKKGTKYF